MWEKLISRYIKKYIRVSLIIIGINVNYLGNKISTLKKRTTNPFPRCGIKGTNVVYIQHFLTVQSFSFHGNLPYVRRQ